MCAPTLPGFLPRTGEQTTKEKPIVHRIYGVLGAPKKTKANMAKGDKNKMYSKFYEAAACFKRQIKVFIRGEGGF